MKRITAIALLAIANFAVAGTSFAQSKAVQAKVPFDFTAGNTLLPSGMYTIEEESPWFIAIKSHDKLIATVSVVDQDGKKSANGGKLIFHKYGSQYFLSEILCDRAAMNVRVPASKTEKRVKLQEAMIAPSSDTFIAAR
jgi:hypothetical protein